jgi:succinate dehydrogenase hydrophobic anchor subunit
MAARGTTVSSMTEGLLYRGREGQLAYLGQRLAGLGTLLFLAIHIVDTSTVYFGQLLGRPDLYSHAIDIYRLPVFMIGEIVLVAALFYHGVNGLRIILHDTFPHWWNKGFERQSFYKVAVLTFLMWLPAAFLMGRSLYVHSFCANCAAEPAVDVAARTNASIAIVPILFFIILGVLAVGGKLTAPAPAGGRVVSVPKTFDTYVWQFMRWSGVVLIPLAWIHVIIQDVLIGVHAIDINFVALRLATVGWRIYDISLLGFAFGHGMLGLRNVVNDHVVNPRWNRAIKWLLLVGWVVITAIGAVAVIGGVKLPAA